MVHKVLQEIFNNMNNTKNHRLTQNGKQFLLH
jgi:hypothetical protein